VDRIVTFKNENGVSVPCTTHFRTNGINNLAKLCNTLSRNIAVFGKPRTARKVRIQTGTVRLSQAIGANRPILGAPG
jgi:hypothetical protein